MKSSCTDHRDLIGGIIGVPNHDIVGDVDEGSPNHTVDDATCVSALSFGGSQEPIDQRQPPMRPSQGAATTRRLHPFPWSTSNDESEVFPDNLPTVKQEDEKATNDGDRPLRRSSLVANDSSLNGKCVNLHTFCLYQTQLCRHNINYILLFLFDFSFQHHGSQHAD